MGSCSWNCRQFSHLLDSLSLLPLIIIVVVVIVMIVVVMIMIITINKVAVFGFEQHLEAAFDICGATCISNTVFLDAIASPSTNPCQSVSE